MKHLIYVTLLVFLAGCGNKPKDKKEELAELKKQQVEIGIKIDQLEKETGTTDSVRVAEVAIVTLQPSIFTSYIEVQGTIDAEDNVIANAEAPGIITSINKKIGDHVSKGQVIATLDSKTLQQSILQAQAQLELNNTLYQRQKNLWDQKIGTEVQYLQAKTSYDVAQKQLAGLQAQASMYRIVSPISGTLDQMDLKIGQAVQPGTQGVRIVNLDRLKVKASIAETYAGKVKQGDKVLVAVPDAADSISSSISYAAKIIDPASRSFNVEVKVPPSKTALKPNMTAVLRIVDYQKNDAIVLPIKAIQKGVNGQYVYIANGNVAKRVEVKTGSSYRGEIEILSGVKAGDKVITEGAQDLEDGDNIHIN